MTQLLGAGSVRAKWPARHAGLALRHQLGEVGGVGGITTTIGDRGGWEPKLARNVRRDVETDELLAAAGWETVHVWEHETAAAAARALVSENVTRPAVATRLDLSTTVDDQENGPIVSTRSFDGAASTTTGRRPHHA